MSRPAEMTSPVPPPARPSWLAYGLFGLALSWVMVLTIVIQISAWVVDQFLLIAREAPLPGWAWAAVALGQALALALPPALLLIRAHPRLAPAYRTLLWAAGLSVCLSLARLIPWTWSQAAALAQIILTLSAGLALWLTDRSRSTGLSSTSTLWPALALAPLLAIPALLWGALGSPLDALLGLCAGLGLGLLAGLLLERKLFRPLAAQGQTGAGLNSLTAGAALLVLGASHGSGGQQLLLALCLPPLGWAATTLASSTRRLALLIGLTAAAPLMLFDPKELTLLLLGGGGLELPEWALRAAGVMTLSSGLAGGLLWLWRRSGFNPRASAWAACIAWLAALALYFSLGRPGFYGEALFVILKDQADVSAAALIPQRPERLRFVYTTLVGQADRTQADLRRTLKRFGIAYRSYYLVNGLEVQGGPLVRLFLTTRPEVARVLESPHLRPLPAPVPAAHGDAPQPDGPPWNITMIGADRVWKELGVTGQGIVIGQSDSGVDGAHPALAAGYRGRTTGDNFNWLDPWNHSPSPMDIGGHGTHTLGTILGRGGIGVAPGAEWIGCVNLARNLGNPAVYLDCLQFMLAPYPQAGDPFRDGDPTRAAHVLNNSWGCPPLEGCDPLALQPAVSALRAAGIFVVASAGNTGPRCASLSDPLALYAQAFTVGAADQAGNVVGFSSRGPVNADGSGRIKPDLLAPGGAALDGSEGILSAFPGGTYQYLEGTSMAGPHVVGAVALMWSANPRLIGDIERTAALLRRTARPYAGAAATCGGVAGQSNDYGSGLLDVYAAVQAAIRDK